MDWTKIRRIVALTIPLIVILAIAVTLLFFSPPIVQEPVKPSPSLFCPAPSPSLDATSEIGIKNVKTSTTDIIGENVGLSAGDFAFDTLGPDSVLKCQASQALQQGKINDAENDWQKALDPERQSNDAEVLIYQENQKILDQKLPYISIIVGVTITTSNSPVGVTITTGNSRDVLQGTYVAQHRYNQDHPNATQLRVIVANFGSTNASITQVAQQIITAKQKDERIEALVNVPAAVLDTPDALSQLYNSNFPIILSNGSANKQENGNNFFHVAPPVAEQGQQAARYVEQNCPNNLPNDPRPYDCEGSNIAVFINTSDSYSSALGTAFRDQLLKDKALNSTNKDPQEYFYESNNILSEVQSFGARPPDLIYFAGNVTDADTLIQDLSQNSAYANLRVLGGDKLYQPGKYTDNHYRHLSFTAFAYPDEWDILKPQLPVPGFFCDYPSDFGGASIPRCRNGQTIPTGASGYGYNRPDSNAILAYDAFQVFIAGAVNANNSASDILQSIRNISGTNAFGGVSGHIDFGPDGNPINKAILVLRVDEQHGYTQQVRQYGAF